MAKRGVKKADSKKTSKKPQTSKKPTVERILIENFVSLQKVLTDVSINFDRLTKQMSKLLELFETSAKSLAEKKFEEGKEDKDFKEMVGKLDELIDQNKIIARGLVMVHEKIGLEERAPAPAKMPAPSAAMPKPAGRGTEGYQKSISAR